MPEDSPNNKEPWRVSKDAKSPGEPLSNSNFPVLGTKGPSKSSAKRRIAYNWTSSPNFDAYPPRSEVILSRQSENEAREGGEASIDNNSDHEGTYRQQNGMSSVVVYHENGQRISGGPDIYNKRRHQNARMNMPNVPIAPGQEQHHEDIQTIPSEKINYPVAMTKERIDQLFSEHQRWQRTQAAQRRLGSTHPILDDTDPLQEQMIGAFSSVEGFLAAFAEEA